MQPGSNFAQRSAAPQASSLKPLATSRFLASFWLLLLAALLSLTAPLAARAADTVLTSLISPPPSVSGTVSLSMATSPDGQYVYAHAVSSIIVIATATNTAIAAIPGINSISEGMAVTPDGNYLYVSTDAASSGNTVSVIATPTNTVDTPNTIVDTITVGNGPAGIAITPDGNYAYVANQVDGTVSVIATATNTVVAGPITVGTNPTGIAITPDGNYAYVTDGVDNTVTVIATASNPDATIRNTVVGSPIAVTSPSSIVFTPDGRYAYVPNGGLHTVSVIDTTAKALVDTINVTATTGGAPSPYPYAIAITPDGHYVYVANYSSRSVSVISTDTNTEVSTLASFIDTPPIFWPTAIVITPDGRDAYVSNNTTGRVAVIALDYPPAITTTSLPAATLNTVYTGPSKTTVTIDTTGGPTPTMTYSGTLPPGLTLDTATGELTGTPTTPGTYTFTVTATNYVHGDTVTAMTATKTYTIVVRDANAGAAAIPTLGDAALILLALLLGASAVAVHRRGR